PTLDASEALESVSVFTEFLATGIAFLAGHRLAFPAKQADNGFGSALRLAPRADLALSVGANYRQGFVLFPAKQKRSTPVATDKLSLRNESLQACIDQGERITDASEVIPPTLKGVPHFHR